MKLLISFLLFFNCPESYAVNWMDTIINGQYCEKCFDFDASDPVDAEVLAVIEKTQSPQHTQNIKTHQQGDFYTSDLGILIHQSCLQELGVDSQGNAKIEVLLKESLTQGLKCIVDLQYDQKTIGSSQFANIVRVLNPAKYNEIMPQILDTARDVKYKKAWQAKMPLQVFCDTSKTSSEAQLVLAKKDLQVAKTTPELFKQIVFEQFMLALGYSSESPLYPSISSSCAKFCFAKSSSESVETEKNKCLIPERREHDIKFLDFDKGYVDHMTEDGWIDIIRDGQYCRKCFNYKKSNPLDAEIDVLPQYLKNQSLTPNILSRKKGVFYESNLNILIHQKCIDAFGIDPDGFAYIEKAYQQAMVKGVQCLSGLREVSKAVTGSHFTNMLYLLRRDRFDAIMPQMLDTSKDPQFKDQEGKGLCFKMKDGEDEFCTTENICDHLERNNLLNGVKCLSYNDRRMKLTCESVSEQDVKGVILGRAPTNMASGSIIERDREFEVISYPTIQIASIHASAYKKHPEHLQSIIFHEFKHNMGYTHGARVSIKNGETVITYFPEYAYSCEAYCFFDETDKRKIDPATKLPYKEIFKNYCVRYPNENNDDEFSNRYQDEFNANFKALLHQ